MAERAGHKRQLVRWRLMSSHREHLSHSKSNNVVSPISSEHIGGEGRIRTRVAGFARPVCFRGSGLRPLGHLSGKTLVEGERFERSWELKVPHPVSNRRQSATLATFRCALLWLGRLDLNQRRPASKAGASTPRPLPNVWYMVIDSNHRAT